jgi:transposase InsO family protein
MSGRNNDTKDLQRHDAWARLRFSIVGHLLAAPPAPGELGEQLQHLARREWRHPISGQPVKFGQSTIERWYYTARNERQDPVGKLRRRVRKDAGRQRQISPQLGVVIREQYDAHKRWSYQLHHDNLEVRVAEDRRLGDLPSYSTLLRWMHSQGLQRQRRKARRQTAGALAAEARLEQREVRSYEAEYVHALWHFDFHHGSLQVVTRTGAWRTPLLLAALDDRSRLCCHAQWYLDETVETLVHGLSQAFQKRGLPRSAMSDNGSAMRAEEFAAGCLELGVVHERTLPYSPYQNAKQEVFWASVEGRLLAMLEGQPNLTIELLNEATQAWVELEYNREVHSEIGVPPLRRFLDDKSVGRDCPGSDRLRAAFRARAIRTQRRSDGTIALAGRRYEIPSRYRTLSRVTIRYASWDLGFVHLVDERTNALLCPIYPIDKAANAEGVRRSLAPVGDAAATAGAAAPAGIAPLLRKMIAEYAATGLPPAYLPKHDVNRGDDAAGAKEIER